MISEPRTGKAVYSISAADSPRTFSFSPDSKFLLVGIEGRQSGIQEFSVVGAPGQLMWDFLSKPVPIGHVDSGLAVRSNDGKKIITPINKTLLGFDSSQKPTWESLGRYSLAAFSSDGSRIVATGYSDTAVRVLQGNSGKLVLQFNFDRPNSVDLNLDGTLVAVGSTRGMVVVRQVETGNELWQLDLKTASAFSGITKVAFSPSGQSIAIGCEDGRLLLLDAKTHKEIRRWTGGGKLFDLQFAIGRKSVVAAFVNNEARVFDLSQIGIY